jgi:hypothetical protein
MSSAITATCHCGAITITAPRKPTKINECQCTICRRYGAAWGYYNTKEVTIEKKKGSSTGEYMWGDKGHGFHFCNTCGCMTHWYPAASRKVPPEGLKMGINTRMMNPADLWNVNREINYDDLKMPLSRKEDAHAEDLAVYRDGL